MKDHPQVHISRTLSRGKADERLFLSLEEAIRNANIAKHEFYAVHDFINRSVDIIKDINGIVDPETGEVHEEIYNRASQKLDKANKILESEESPWGTINYAKIMLDSCRSLMNPQEIGHIGDYSPEIGEKQQGRQLRGNPCHYQGFEQGVGKASDGAAFSWRWKGPMTTTESITLRRRSVF